MSSSTFQRGSASQYDTIVLDLGGLTFLAFVEVSSSLYTLVSQAQLV